jgi:hypothetical protein
MAKIAIKIQNEYFTDIQLYGKTLYAAKDIPMYFSPLLKKQLGVIKRGQPIGTFQVFNPAQPAKNINFPTIGVGRTTNALTFFKYENDVIQSAALKRQGTRTTSEEVIEAAKEEQNANKTWYEKLAENILPYAAGVAIAFFIIQKKVK